MKLFLSLINHLYALTLFLYPRQYRVEFGEEMQAVFSQRLQQAAREGFYPLLGRLWLETYTFPSGLLASYQDARPLMVLFLLVLGLIQAAIFSFFMMFALGIGFYWFFTFGKFFTLCIPLVYGLVLLAWKTNPELKLMAGVIILAGSLYPTHALMGIDIGYVDFPLNFLWWGLYAMLPVSVIVATVLLYAALGQIPGRYGGRSQHKLKYPSIINSPNRLRSLCLILAAMILGKMLYNVYQLTLWDNTYDPLGHLWIVFPVAGSFVSGLMLSVGLPGKTKFISLAYALIVPGALFLVSTLAQQVDFRQLTEQRAERLVLAIDSYYQRNQRYPEQLQDLTPQYVLSLGEPMIIYGQDWCYHSGDNFYQLGYVSKEHWSSPILEGVVYTSQGNPVGEFSLCEEQIADLKRSKPNFYR
ncbi:MAG: hypothetical protein IBX69_12500 [Anaerolineales bacterium]|nr:hypothetical protein [Anaerolineales bacterium]